MNLSKRCQKLGLKYEGGVYRALPLLPLSCVAWGYCVPIRQIAGMSYQALGGVGNSRGWYSLVNIESVVQKISLKLAHDSYWFSETRGQALKQYQDFAFQ